MASSSLDTHSSHLSPLTTISPPAPGCSSCASSCSLQSPPHTYNLGNPNPIFLSALLRMLLQLHPKLITLLTLGTNVAPNLMVPGSVTLQLLLVEKLLTPVVTHTSSSFWIHLDFPSSSLATGSSLHTCSSLSPPAPLVTTAPPSTHSPFFIRA